MRDEQTPGAPVAGAPAQPEVATTPIGTASSALLRVVRACLEHPARWRLVSQITLVVVALVIPLELIVLWSGVANLEERRAAELEHSVLIGQALAAVVDGFAGDLQSSTLSTAIALGAQPGPLDPETVGPAVELKRRALESEERVEGEIDLPDGDGSADLPARRWHLTAEPLRDAAGAVVGITCVMLDVTERRALERLQQEFISLVSHELRNPLASIKGYAQLLHRRSEYNERAMQSIVEQSDHLDRLISDLLDSSRVEAGRLTLQPRRGNLIDMLTSSVERIQA